MSNVSFRVLNILREWAKNEKIQNKYILDIYDAVDDYSELGKGWWTAIIEISSAENSDDNPTGSCDNPTCRKSIYDGSQYCNDDCRNSYKSGGNVDSDFFEKGAVWIDEDGTKIKVNSVRGNTVGTSLMFPGDKKYEKNTPDSKSNWLKVIKSSGLKLMKDGGSVDGNKSWSLIKKLNYKIDDDYSRVGKEIAKLTNAQAKELWEFVNSKAENLEKRFGDKIKRVGDDSWSDIRYDVISRGENFYNKVTLPILQRIVDRSDYSESFLYSFQDVMKSGGEVKPIFESGVNISRPFWFSENGLFSQEGYKIINKFNENSTAVFITFKGGNTKSEALRKANLYYEALKGVKSESEIDEKTLKFIKSWNAKHKKLKRGGITGMNEKNCQRCKKSTDGITTMSMFNEDVICMTCKTKEKTHPNYKSALKADSDAIKSGNYNFKGVGYSHMKSGGEIINYIEKRNSKRKSNDPYSKSFGTIKWEWGMLPMNKRKALAIESGVDSKVAHKIAYKEQDWDDIMYGSNKEVGAANKIISYLKSNNIVKLKAGGKVDRQGNNIGVWKNGEYAKIFVATSVAQLKKAVGNKVWDSFSGGDDERWEEWFNATNANVSLSEYDDSVEVLVSGSGNIPEYADNDGVLETYLAEDWGAAIGKSNGDSYKSGGTVNSLQKSLKFKASELKELKEWKQDRIESLNEKADDLGITQKHRSYSSALERLDKIVETCKKLIKSGFLKNGEYSYVKRYKISSYDGSIEIDGAVGLDKYIVFDDKDFQKQWDAHKKQYPHSYDKTRFAAEKIGELTTKILGFPLGKSSAYFYTARSVGKSFKAGGNVNEDRSRDLKFQSKEPHEIRYAKRKNLKRRKYKKETGGFVPNYNPDNLKVGDSVELSSDAWFRSTGLKKGYVHLIDESNGKILVTSTKKLKPEESEYFSKVSWWKPTSFKSGGSIPYNFQASGVYEFKTKEKTYKLRIAGFELEGENTVLLYQMDLDRNEEIRAIKLKETALKRVVKGSKVKAESTTGMQGTLSYISKLNFKTGGSVNDKVEPYRSILQELISADFIDMENPMHDEVLSALKNNDAKELKDLFEELDGAGLVPEEFFDESFKIGGKVVVGRERLYKDKNVALDHNTVSDTYSIVDPNTGKFLELGGYVFGSASGGHIGCKSTKEKGGNVSEKYEYIPVNEIESIETIDGKILYYPLSGAYIGDERLVSNPNQLKLEFKNGGKLSDRAYYIPSFKIKNIVVDDGTKISGNKIVNGFWIEITKREQQLLDEYYRDQAIRKLKPANKSWFLMVRKSKNMYWEQTHAGPVTKAMAEKKLNAYKKSKKPFYELAIHPDIGFKLGGEVTEINEDGSNLPKPLYELFGEIDEDEDPYKEMERLRLKANEIGYDFDYGLSGEPTDFWKTDKMKSGTHRF